MCSQVNPILSNAPGAKFSTNTSASRISFSRIALPSGVFVSSSQRPLVAVEHREIQRVQTGDVTQLITRDVSNAYPLDFQYIGAEPRQQLRTCWSSLHAGEVDNFDSFKWQLHDQTLLIVRSSKMRYVRHE